MNFPDVPPTANLTLRRFPDDYAALPTVSFVIPDLCGDMHDCPVATGDGWLRTHLGGYVTWAQTHNSLLIVTFDEDDETAGNRILTVFSGGPVRPGSYDTRSAFYRRKWYVDQLWELSLDVAGRLAAGDLTDSTGKKSERRENNRSLHG